MKMIIRHARAGDETGIHQAHMRSIREICIKDHGADEVSGWGYRQDGGRWAKSIQTGIVWVIGLAKQLLNLMIEEAKSKNIEQITLESTITAHGFYMKNGFRDTASMQKLEIGGQPVSYFPMFLDLV